MDKERKAGQGCDGEVSNEGKVSKDILPSMFYESDHISSKHGRQLQKHIADQDVCVRDN